MPDINRVKTAGRRIVRCFRLLKHIKQLNRGKVREKSIYFLTMSGRKVIGSRFILLPDVGLA
jgi:hypothetical protein